MALQQATYLNRFPTLRLGISVYSKDGEKLGKITNLFDDYFILEKGIFFPKDFTLRYEDIQDVSDDTVYLRLSNEDLTEWKNESYAGWQQTEGINTGRLSASPLDEYKDQYKGRFTEETKVPIVEEELNAEKIQKQVGEVKVRKIVHTELRHFTVPVTREEVSITRVPASAQAESLPPGEASFQETTINVPVMEEEVKITKRPVVKEEIRISKERTTEEKVVEGEIRKEDVSIEGEEALKRKKAG